MPRHRGGASLSVDDLKTVLGRNFRDYVSMVNDNDSLSQFTIGALTPGSVDARHKANDISYMLSQYLLALADVTRQLDAPNVATRTNASTYYGTLLEAVKADVASTAGRSTMTFAQLPYWERLAYISPGSTLLDSSFYSQSETSLGKPIRYIQYYIAHLDTSSNANEVLTLLLNTPDFIDMHNDAVADLSGFITRSNTFDAGVSELTSNGLKAVYYNVITRMINVVRDLPPAVGIPQSNTAADLIKELTTDGPLSKELAAIDIAAAADNAKLQAGQFKTANILLNPTYLDAPYEKTIDDTKAAQFKRITDSGMVGGAPDTTSLPFLYSLDGTGKVYTMVPAADTTAAPLIRTFLTNQRATSPERKFYLAAIIGALTTGDLSFKYTAGALDLAEEARLRALVDRLPAKYALFAGRIRRINQTTLADIKDQIGSTFVYAVNKNIDVNQGTGKLSYTAPGDFKPVVQAPGSTGWGDLNRFQPGGAGPLTLDDPALFQFYNEEIIPNAPLYAKYFNLVKDDGTSGQLMDISGVSAADRSKFRLNAKKAYQMDYYNGLRGGASLRPGEILLLSLIPELTSAYGTVWLTPSQEYATGVDALRTLFLAAYTTPIGSPVVINGIPFDLQDLVASVNRTGVFGQAYMAALKSLRNVPGTGSGVMPGWSVAEMGINADLFKKGNRWKFHDHRFFVPAPGHEHDDLCRPDAQVVEMPQEFKKNCNFMRNVDNAECTRIMAECIDKNDTQGCLDILRKDFDIPVNPQEIVKLGQEIDPAIALKILKRFRFETIPGMFNHKGKDIRISKIENVDRWMRRLVGSCDAPPTTGDCSMKTLLGPYYDEIIRMSKDPSKGGFFKYLEILVNWVNANPNALNEEISTRRPMASLMGYPKPDKSYAIYRYADPNKSISIRAHQMACSVDALRNSIMARINGLNGSILSADLFNPRYEDTIALIDQPFARSSTFAYPYPSWYTTSAQSPFAMVQAGGFVTSNALDTPLNGYQTLSDVYEEIVNMFDTDKGMCISPGTKQRIIANLQAIKTAEETFLEDATRIAQATRIYRASNGAVDIPLDNRAAFDALVEKHQNLISTGQKYNQKTMEVLEYYTKMLNYLMKIGKN